jgi:hypothetical protein
VDVGMRELWSWTNLDTGDELNHQSLDESLKLVESYKKRKKEDEKRKEEEKV